MKVLEHYRPQADGLQQEEHKISVIVAAYNIDAYIERSVHSICSQTYRNLEIILVDDGSTDATGVLCDKLAAGDQRIKVIHKVNEGPAQARNAGIAIATGTFIGFVDGDDYIDTDMYEKMLASILDQDADLAICRYRQVHADFTEDLSADRAIVFEEQEALQYYVQEKKEYDIQNAAWNKLYRKEVLENVTFPAGKWYEDIMFATCALARAKRCVYLDTAYYNYIIDREGSIMNTQINPRTFTDQIPAYLEKTKFLAKLGRPDLADIHDYFFYKRLLLFYDQIVKSSMDGKQEYLNTIVKILCENASHVKQVFGCDEASKRDRKLIALFLKSRERYTRKVDFDENVLFPLKRKVKAVLRGKR